MLTEHCGYHDDDGYELNLTDDFEEVTPPVPSILAATPLKFISRDSHLEEVSSHLPQHDIWLGRKVVMKLLDVLS